MALVGAFDLHSHPVHPLITVFRLPLQQSNSKEVRTMSLCAVSRNTTTRINLLFQPGRFSQLLLAPLIFFLGYSSDRVLTSGFRGLGFRGLGFRRSGFRGLGIRCHLRHSLQPFSSISCSVRNSNSVSTDFSLISSYLRLILFENSTWLVTLTLAGKACMCRRRILNEAGKWGHNHTSRSSGRLDLGFRDSCKF